MASVFYYSVASAAVAAAAAVAVAVAAAAVVAAVVVAAAVVAAAGAAAAVGVAIPSSGDPRTAASGPSSTSSYTHVHLAEPLVNQNELENPF